MQAIRLTNILKRPPDQDLIDPPNVNNHVTNDDCALSPNLCQRVCALIDLPELLLLTTKKNFTKKVQPSDKNNRIYYIEANLYKETSIEQLQPTEKVPIKSLKKPKGMRMRCGQGQHDQNVAQQKSNEMLRSFMVWVNSWTSTGNNNLNFEKVTGFFEKLVPNDG